MFDVKLFSERLKKARTDKGYSQEDLAKKIGVSSATISSYESLKNPKICAFDKACSLAETLGVSLDWLCGIEKEANNSKLTFKDVMNAIIILTRIKGTSLVASKNPNFSIPSCEININSWVIRQFIEEYNKITDFINGTDYPQYLKDGLIEALFKKFSKYAVIDGDIKDLDASEKLDDFEDILVDGKAPF